MKIIGIYLTLVLVEGAAPPYAPAGCTFDPVLERATCDFARWNPPLEEFTFGPGSIYQIYVDNVDGTLPPQVLNM